MNDTTQAVEPHRVPVGRPPPATRPLSHPMHRDSAAAGIDLALVEAEHRVAHQREQWRHAELYAFGRMLFGSVFLIAALAKLAHFAPTAQGMETLGLTDVSLLLGFGIGAELVGGLLVLLGFRTRAAALGLVAYLASVTLLVNHDFALEMNREAALMNLGMVAGLLLLFGHGSGALSVDRWLARRTSRRFHT